MKIHLDTSDLINLVEKKTEAERQAFYQLLQRGSYQIVLSYVNLTEIVAPLNQGKIFSDISPTLDRLEELPHCYQADPIGLELHAALKSFALGTPPPRVDPYVPRADYVFSPNGISPYRNIVNQRLRDIILELYRVKVEFGFGDTRNAFEDLVQADRNSLDLGLKASPAHCVTVLERHLQTYGLIGQGTDTRGIGHWLYDHPQFVPSLRISYEMYHEILRNRTNAAQPGDLGDFNPIISLPYVDLVTTDRRMVGYLRQVLKRLSIAHLDFHLLFDRICTNLDDVQCKLQAQSEDKFM